VIIALFTWLVVSSLITALLEAWSLQHLWAWFAAAELGPGPSMGAWYGVASIFALALFMSKPLPSPPSEEKSTADTLRSAVSRSFSRWIFCALGVGVTWTAGSVIGWVR
jgi:hypothetical protein